MKLLLAAADPALEDILVRTHFGHTGIQWLPVVSTLQQAQGVLATGPAEAAAVDASLPCAAELLDWLCREHGTDMVIACLDGPPDGFTLPGGCLNLSLDRPRPEEAFREIADEACRRGIPEVPPPDPWAVPRGSFWDRFLLPLGLREPELIRLEADRRGILRDPDERFTILRIRAWRPTRTHTAERVLLEHRFHYALGAYIARWPLILEEIAAEDRGVYRVVLRQAARVEDALVEEGCRRFAAFCEENIRCRIGCCFFANSPLPFIVSAMDQIVRVSLDVEEDESWVWSTKAYHLRDSGYCSGEFQRRLGGLLTSRGIDAFLGELDSVIGSYERRKKAGTHLLTVMRADLEEIIGKALCHLGRDPREVLESVPARQLARASIHSAREMMAYAQGVLLPHAELFPSPQRYAEPVEAAMAYMEQHLADPFSRAELGRVSGLNPNYLAALFKNQTGLSLREYHGQIRIHEAMRLLRETDLPLVEVARLTGYGDSPRFSNAFRLLTNTTPGAYRRSFRDNGKSHALGERPPKAKKGTDEPS